MSFNAGTIAGVLKLDTDPYAQGMLKATTIAQAFPATVTAFLTNPMIGFYEVLKTVGTGFASFMRDMTDQDDALSDLATSVGVAVSDLDALGKAAIFAGSNAEGVGESYRFLGRSISEAMAGAESGAAKTFRTLGVEFMSAGGAARPLQGVLLDLADAFAKLPEGGARTTAAMDLLGRGGASLVPLLIQGKTAIIEQMDQMRAYGAVVSGTANESAGKWNDAMDEMSIAWGGLKRSFAEPIRFALLPHLESLTKWTRTNQPMIRESIGGMVDSVIDGFGKLGAAFDFIGEH